MEMNTSKRKKPSFRVLRHRPVYRGRAVELAVDRVRLPNGKIIEREIIFHPGSAVMIPLLGPDKVILIRQFRYSTGGFIWEFPAGTACPGEEAALCAGRELEEEIGYRAGSLRRLLTFYPTPGVSNEIMHLFLAQKLVRTRRKLEEDEILQSRAFSRRQIGSMIRRGKIIDGKTILGFLIWKNGWKKS
jgi:ADP-ribose pyrophosphatase